MPGEAVGNTELRLGLGILRTSRTTPRLSAWRTAPLSVVPGGLAGMQDGKRSVHCNKSINTNAISVYWNLASHAAEKKMRCELTSQLQESA